MRKNMFGETYLDEGDSIVDFIAENEIETEELSALIDPDDNGTYTAEILGDGGPVFCVEGYVSDLDLQSELLDAGIQFVEISE
ncbi:hypothetical protein N9Y00_07910 [Tateyamaria sp.]|nr:hypothetical protein [Tateyamaria sp.]